MASSFKIGERFREQARDLLEGESSVSEELREELKALTDQSIIPFKTVRKLHKLLQDNGKKRAHSIEQLNVLILHITSWVWCNCRTSSVSSWTVWGQHTSSSRSYRTSKGKWEYCITLCIILKQKIIFFTVFFLKLGICIYFHPTEPPVGGPLRKN